MYCTVTIAQTSMAQFQSALILLVILALLSGSVGV